MWPPLEECDFCLNAAILFEAMFRRVGRPRLKRFVSSLNFGWDHLYPSTECSQYDAQLA